MTDINFDDPAALDARPALGSAAELFSAAYATGYKPIADDLLQHMARVALAHSADSRRPN